MQLFEFKNNKIISKYQNISMIIENYTKNQCKRTKIPLDAKLIFCLFQIKIKMYFNYLTVCER